MIKLPDMQRYCLIGLVLCFLTIKSFCQTITTGIISGSPFCAGTNINVPYTVTGTFTVGNVFTAQLSDASGNFATAADIGFLASISAGTIAAQVPFNQSAGTLYRIRVIASLPSTIGTTNGDNLSIVLGINAPVFTETIFCPGQAISIGYTVLNSCGFPNVPSNIFTAQLSNPFGSFTSPTSIGTTLSNNSGTIIGIIPIDAVAGNGYRIRIVSSNPGAGLVSPNNGTNLTINSYGINPPSFSETSFCQGQVFNIGYSIKNGCSFLNVPSNNIFTAQLSDASGSFSSPTPIGSVVANGGGFISATIPGGTPPGSAYRVRIISSNPTIISSNNGISLIVNASSGNPSEFGTATWNTYVYAGTAFPISNNTYVGTYTEDNLNFNTANRWNPANGPSFANTSSGQAYAGCPVGGANYSVSFKRTNFTCGYYQIDVPFQDDFLTLLIDGVQVFQKNVYTPRLQTNVWTGFLGPSSTVEFQLINFADVGILEILISPSAASPHFLNTNSTVCAGTAANLIATSSIPGVTYSWFIFDDVTNTTSFVPSSTIANPKLQTSVATPAGDYTVVNVLTDAARTGCTALKSVIITVNPLPNTSVIPSSATSVTTACVNLGVTLTASGANTYSWSPSTGLSATTGFSVLATPVVTTTYTVTGNNNCSANSASTTITVNALPPVNTFPTGTWNVYGFNSSTVGTNYEGYYTEDGSGATGLNFDTRTRWASDDVASTAGAINGTAWQGCPLRATNTTLSFKRTGFTCGVYQIAVPSHDDGFLLFVNGVQVAKHDGCCDNHANLWTGALNPNSTIEWHLIQNIGESYLEVSFALIAQPSSTTVWLGGISSDWFNASNWCNGVPTSTTDALIPAAGPQNMPMVNAGGAVAKNVTISSAIPIGTFTSAISSASLTTNAFNLDVYGNWTNNGTFTPNAGSVGFLGPSGGSTITCSSLETFNNIIINKPNGITFSAGTHQVSGTLTLTNGIVVQNSSLQILNGGSVSGASNSSYVDGVITKIGNTVFTFPVGKSLLYRPISISAPSVASDAFSAQYFNVNPNNIYPIAQRAATLDRVSSAEYWMLNRIAGASNVNVTLSWGSNSEAVINPNLLRVATWNGSLWTDQGNGATTGTATSGTVRTAASSAIYGPFTLNENKLPVGLEDPLSNKTDITIYPNPATNNASIELNNAPFNSISINNNLGQEIHCDYIVGSTKAEINTSNLAAGLYIVSVLVDEKLYKLKLLIQR
jgi:hypothetical protein